jgi:hypothetical protein
MHRALILILVLAVLLASGGCSARPGTAPSAVPSTVAARPTPLPPTTAPPTASATRPAAGDGTARPTTPTTGTEASDPFALVSQDSLFQTLEDLTAIQLYSGWRSSASQGEQEALDYVQGRLAGLDYLRDLGLEIERQSFRVPIGTEMWTSRLELRSGGRDTEVPAAALRGDREDVARALNLDSDGVLNDQQQQPVTAEGPVVLIRSASGIDSADAADVGGKIVLLDYAVVDRIVGDSSRAVALASDLLSRRPAAVVMVTQNSNEVGASHGFGAGDLSAFTWASRPADLEQPIPVLYVRIEDLSPAGITGWDELAEVESARVTWDADVSSPANSGNVVAHIPGADPSRALILGAHIDSPNGPGAMDDGSGVAVLLEVARALDAARVQPPVDLVLAWFGSEELGLIGSSYFVGTHQELLDRAVGMLEVDCLSRPLDGIPAELALITQSYGRLGDTSLPWPDAVARAASLAGVETVPANSYTPWSDNSPFGGYGVPNADLIYMDEAAMEATGSLHYAAHIHDPYDTVEMARDVAGVFEDMARVALSAVVNADLAASYRVAPPAKQRAVLVGSHTEMPHMTPAALTDFGMALSLEGFDVDLVPYGRPVTAEDLEGSDLVIVLPVVDLVPAADDASAYDDAWTGPEIAALERYASDGGLLVLANSANLFKYYNRTVDPNEDAGDANALSGRFGVTFIDQVLPGGQARVQGDSPLTAGLSTLSLAADNGVAFEVDGGQILATVGQQPAVALLEVGQAGGEVLVLADLGLLGSNGGPQLDNLPFWQNLAGYARTR